MLSASDLRLIAHEQIRREDAAAPHARGVLVCDTSPLTTWGYSDWMFGAPDAAIEPLASRRYEGVVLCAPDIPFVQDGTRQQAAFRERQQAWYLAQVARLDLPLLQVHGPVVERVEQVVQALAKGFATAH